MGRLKRGTRSDCAFASEYIHFYDARPRKEGYKERNMQSKNDEMRGNTSRAVAHLSVVIFVSLRTAASLVAPSSLMSLTPRL